MSLSLRKRVFRLAFISICTILATLFILEIVVQAVPLYPDVFVTSGSWPGWRYQPNKSGIWVNAMCWGQIRNEVHINNHGLHDIERTYEKPAGVQRIALLGDSMIAAFEVPIEQAVHRRLETLLNQDNAETRYEVIAIGHQGYGTDLELIYYQEAAYRYQPDLVLLLMQPHNDFDDNYPGLLGASGNNPLFSLDEQGQLVRHTSPPDPLTSYPLHDFLNQASRLYKLVQARMLARQTTPMMDDETRQQHLQKAWELTFALVDNIRRQVEESGSRFGVIVEQSIIAPAEDRARVHEEISERLEALNIRHLSLQPAFDAADSADKPLRYSCDTHWTPEGHQFAAETIAPFIQQFFTEGETSQTATHEQYTSIGTH